jgi:hypothetical protein
MGPRPRRGMVFQSEKRLSIKHLQWGRDTPYRGMLCKKGTFIRGTLRREWPSPAGGPGVVALESCSHARWHEKALALIRLDRDLT